MYKYDGYIGGYVWEWCDHSVYMGKTIDGRDKFYYGGDWNEEIHDGNFCMDGLVYPDRRPHTGLLEHKNVARPIRRFPGKRGNWHCCLDNKMDFTNIRDRYQIAYEIVTDGEVTASGVLSDVDCPAKTAVEVQIPEKLPKAGNTFLHLHYIQKDADLLTPAGYEAGHDQLTVSRDADAARAAVAKSAGCGLSADTGAQVTVEDLENQLVVCGQGFRYVFDKWKGTFSALVKDGSSLIEKPIELNVWRAPMDNDRRVREEWEAAGYDRARIKVYETSWEVSDNQAVITSRYSLYAVYLQRIVTGTLTWTVSGSGAVTVKVDGERSPIPMNFCPHPASDDAFPAPFRPAAVSACLLRSGDLLCYGPQESYPDKHRDAYVDLFTQSSAASRITCVPRRTGSHWGCTALAAGTRDGRHLLVSGQEFSFNASVYTQEELTEKSPQL